MNTTKNDMKQPSRMI